MAGYSEGLILSGSRYLLELRFKAWMDKTTFLHQEFFRLSSFVFRLSSFEESFVVVLFFGRSRGFGVLLYGSLESWQESSFESWESSWVGVV